MRNLVMSIAKGILFGMIFILVNILADITGIDTTKYQKIVCIVVFLLGMTFLNIGSSTKKVLWGFAYLFAYLIVTARFDHFFHPSSEILSFKDQVVNLIYYNFILHIGVLMIIGQYVKEKLKTCSVVKKWIE